MTKLLSLSLYIACITSNNLFPFVFIGLFVLFVCLFVLFLFVVVVVVVVVSPPPPFESFEFLSDLQRRMTHCEF